MCIRDRAKTITEKGYDLNVDPWAPEWSAAVESDDTFCYVLPTWGYQFVVKPSAVNTVGQWALCEGPVPYVKGGTWLGIYKDSPNKDLDVYKRQVLLKQATRPTYHPAARGEFLQPADTVLSA